jgi:hypothetical protein
MGYGFVSRYDSRGDLASKIDWEGGIYGFLQYGFDPGDCPEGDDELIEAATELRVRWYEMRAAADGFMALLPEVGDDDFDS